MCSVFLHKIHSSAGQIVSYLGGTGYDCLLHWFYLLYWTKNLKLLVFRPFQFQEKEKTNSGYKHNNTISHGIFNLTFRMLQHTSSEVTVTKYEEI